MFEAAFMQLALVASTSAAAALGVVGVYMTIRRTAFMGLVLASASTVGAAIAQLAGWSQDAEAVMAVVAAVGFGLALGTMPPSRRISAESVTGWAYAAASSVTVLVLAGTTAGDTDTLHLLYGNVLAASPGHTIGLVVVALVVAAAQWLFGPRFLLVAFDPEGARVAGVHPHVWSLGLNLLIGVAVAMAVHEVGTLFAFSLLTLGPAVSLLLTRSTRAMFVLSAVSGIVAAIGGLVAAFQLDLPPGPTAVALLVAAVAAAGIFSRQSN
jgi:ABC-type Mn2+/Zn2+ transport system permease subunit